MRFSIFLTSVAILAAALYGADEPTEPTRADGVPADQVDSKGPVTDRTAEDKAALSEIQSYVGKWKGVGQPRRGSSQGSWSEQSDWSWKFADGRAFLVFESPAGHYYVSGRLLAADKEGEFVLSARRNDDSNDEFAGDLNSQSHLVLERREPGEERDTTIDESAEPPTEGPTRITLRQVADGDRLLVLYEARAPGKNRYVRLAEVGYTRQGSSFAKGSGQPECIVTGGLGTIQVMHEGKKYYVCCTGCRDLFNDDPAGVLAEYRAAKKREKEERDANAK